KPIPFGYFAVWTCTLHPEGSLRRAHLPNVFLPTTMSKSRISHHHRRIILPHPPPPPPLPFKPKSTLLARFYKEHGGPTPTLGSCPQCDPRGLVLMSTAQYRIHRRLHVLKVVEE